MGLFDCKDQPLQVWGKPSGGWPAFPLEVEVFVVENPCKHDILALIGTDPKNCRNCHTWTLCETDLEGCYKLKDPQVVQCTIPITKPEIPTLCLLDALETSYFTAVAELVFHSPTTPAIYDSRKLQKSYFRCVLAQGEVWRAGVSG